MKTSKYQVLKNHLKVLAEKARNNKIVYRKSISLADKRHNPNRPQSESWQKLSRWYDDWWKDVNDYRETNGYERHDYSMEFRHHHIAYCELRGRTREQIERPREGNEPSETYISELKEKFISMAADDEAVRAVEE